MSNYTKTTDFEAKDSLPTGDSGKIIRGAEFETEFDAISTAIATKADTAGPTFTGTATFATTNATTVQIGGVAITSTAAELNTLDGITSTTAELNTLDGFTGTVDDLNYAKDLRASGVTSAEFDILDGLTATADELNILDGATVTTAELNLLDGVTATTAELNYVDGVTSSIQTQIDTKSPTASPTFTGTVTIPTVDINAGTIDGATIGGTTPAAVSATTVSATGNITVDGTVDGRDVAADGTKLDGIESGATADQTAAEIRTLVDSATDSNVFTDADHTKLDGIEASATADQTDAEIRAAIEAATDSNVFTDADHTKLDGIEALADVTDTTNVTAAGALMDSELTDITAVKALDQGVATTDSPTFAGLTTTADVSFGDNDKAIFGAGSDLEIYHSGTHSIINETGTGELKIQATNLRLQSASGGENYLTADLNGAVRVYYDDAKKFQTTSTGIDVTGTVTADSLTVDGTTDLNIGTANIGIDMTSADEGSYIQVKDNNATGFYFGARAGSFDVYDTNNNAILKANSNGDISFYEDTGTTAKLFWDASAETLTIGSPNSSAIGFVSNGVASLGGGIAFDAGAGNDVQLFNYRTSNMQFGNGGTADVTIDSAGNVGIGTDSPETLVDLKDTTPTLRLTDDRNITWSGNETLGNIEFFSSDTSISGTHVTGFIKNINDRSGGSVQVAGALTFGVSDYDTAASEAMRIDSTGRVGIGTSSPATILDVNGEAPTLTLRDSRTGGTWSAGTALGKLDFYTSDVTGIGAHSIASIGVVAGGLNTASPDGELVFSTGPYNTTATEAMRIDSSGNVGIGTSPATKLHIENDASTYEIIRIGSSTVTHDTGLYMRTTGTAGISWGGGGALAFYGNGAGNEERMRIDSSGNLLVGKSDTNTGVAGAELRANGFNAFCRDGGEVMNINRLTSDGTIIDFRKDSSTVGSIGVDNSDNLYITGNSSHAGLMCGSTEILPYKGTTLNDGANDLGASSFRWKDLYLSGGVVFGTTGGNVTGATLDDYEEGTWTPSLVATGLSVTYDARAGNYTKIGNVVHFIIQFGTDSVTGGSASNSLTITNLPFTAGVRPSTGSFGFTYSTATDISGARFSIATGSTTMSLYQGGDTTGFTSVKSDVLRTTADSNRIYIAGFYYAT